VQRIFTTAMDFTAVMPPAIDVPVIAVEATTPYVRPRVSIPAGLTSDLYDLAYSQVRTRGSGAAQWALKLSQCWIAATAATDYTVPDLSGVTGWQTSWGLAAGQTSWTQSTASSDAGVADLLRVDQTVSELDGREYKSTSRAGTVTF
jgi:hypothetical protein